MIALTDIDALAVLSGARVRLTDTHPIPKRWEWCADVLLFFGYTGQWQTAPLAEMLADLALDPSDPDVARLLDRRIAAILYGEDFECAWLTVTFGNDPMWMIRVSSAGHSMQGHRLSVEPTWDAIKGIAPMPANIPTARVALIRALYPRKT